MSGLGSRQYPGSRYSCWQMVVKFSISPLAIPAWICMSLGQSRSFWSLPPAYLAKDWGGEVRVGVHIIGSKSHPDHSFHPQLQSTGRLLEEQLPEMMTELLASARDKMLCPSESMLTRSLLLEVIELHANSWNPLTPPITQYYNRTIQKLTA